MPDDPKMNRFFAIVNLERGLIAAGAALLVGVVLLLIAINVWREANFGPLNYAETMRYVIPERHSSRSGSRPYFGDSS